LGDARVCRRNPVGKLPDLYLRGTPDGTNKISILNPKILKGIILLAVSFPFLFGGPAFFYWIAGPALQQGNWVPAAFIVTGMFVGVGIVVRAIGILLDGFFGR
jgi:hypothetical protein